MICMTVILATTLGQAQIIPLITSAKKYTITVTSGANGTVSPATVKVKAHSNKTFTILGSAGYLIDALTIDGVGVDTAAVKTFTNVTANHTISATFKVAAETAIRFDKADSANFNNHASPHTLATTVGTGTNQYSIVAITGYLGTAFLVDSVKVGTVKCDSLGAIRTSHNPEDGAYFYGIKNLSTGAQTFTVYSHTATGFYGQVMCINLFGVNQTTPTGAVASGEDSSSAPSATISNTTGNWVIDVCGNAGSVGFNSAGTNQTVAATISTNSDGENGAMSYKSATGTTSSWTLAGGRWHWILAIVVNNP
jgi:hypothetical protein